MNYTINTSVGFFTIRGLKHREVKQVNFRDKAGKAGDGADDLQDEVLKIVLGDECSRVDELIEYERILLFSKIIDLTFMTDDQRKNYNWQWASTLPETTTPVPTANCQDYNIAGAAQTSAGEQT